jgi:PhnB protein
VHTQPTKTDPIRDLQVYRFIKEEPMPSDAYPNPFQGSLAPWLSVRNAARAVVFYQKAFGAVEVYRLEDPGGGVVSRLAVYGGEFWLSDEAPEYGNFSPQTLGGATARMILTVADPDAVHAQALAAGAAQVSPVSEDYGWRIGRVVDPFGHHWEIGRPLSDKS